MFTHLPVTKEILNYLNKQDGSLTTSEIVDAIAQLRGVSRGSISMLVYQGLQRLQRSSEVESAKKFGCNGVVWWVSHH